METPEMKVCTRCHEDLPLSAFYPRRNRSSGVQSMCRECMKARRRRYGTMSRAGHVFVRYDPEAHFKERFWSKVDRSSPDGCWLWLASQKHGGYGQFNWKGRPLLAHRVSYELAHGKDSIPSGLFVLHRCDNPPCVRPNHLWLGTDEDNKRDMIGKGRQKHLNPEVLRAVKELRAAGMKQKAIAARFGVCQTTVWRWLRKP